MKEQAGKVPAGDSSGLEKGPNSARVDLSLLVNMTIEGKLVSLAGCLSVK